MGRRCGRRAPVDEIMENNCRGGSHTQSGKSFNALLREELSQISSSLIPDEVDEKESELDELYSIKEQNASKMNVQSPSPILNPPTHTQDDLPSTVLKTLELRHKQNANGCLGLVRLQGKESVVIPAQQTVALCGKANVNGLSTKECVLLEPPSNSFLPRGVLFSRGVVQVPSFPTQKLTVQLRNESYRDVVLQPNAVVAEVHAIESIIPQECEMGSVPAGQFTAKHLGEDKGVVMDCAAVQAVWDKHLIQQGCGTPVALVESLAMEQ
ncbi:hypothetical protein DPX16_14631 [Anabarilius grahami]|uniref:Uncharacterized protein n=1 Tax=Anabarilius grahami TaxID=495550 RepID=A0A3N0YY85_ANAGA|nr:hypothetical protein DPX16_14631 [Anabarilius grahami]